MPEEAAAPKKGRKVRKRGKKQRKGKKHLSIKVWESYKEGKRKQESCPRCGPGTWMGGHKNRKYCGKCGYTEIKPQGK